MNRDEAIAILGDRYDPASGNIRGDSDYVEWFIGGKLACLDGCFSADELEAIAVIMRSNRAAF